MPLDMEIGLIFNMGKVTIQSMARELGFSRNTVSMALKGNETVAPQTREMILRYAERAGYPGVYSTGRDMEPDENATYHIMILRKPDMAVYWDKIISGISEEACRNQCQTQVAVVTDEAEERLQLPLGLDESIQAVFGVKMLNRDYINKIKAMGIQIYMLDSYKGEEEAPLGDVVKMESFHPVMQLTQHLISQGMRRIGFLNESSSLFESMNDRYSGYLYAMKKAGLTPDPAIVMPDMESGTFYFPETFEKIVEGYEALPEAVVCGNDSIAKYLTQAFRKKGIRVPEDVAVTGFDNDEEDMLSPFFTTVNVDAKWLGKRMVQCFLWRIRHPDAPYEKVAVSGQIVIRKSSCRQRKNER